MFFPWKGTFTLTPGKGWGKYSSTFPPKNNNKKNNVNIYLCFKYILYGIVYILYMYILYKFYSEKIIFSPIVYIHPLEGLYYITSPRSKGMPSDVVQRLRRFNGYRFYWSQSMRASDPLSAASRRRPRPYLQRMLELPSSVACKATPSKNAHDAGEWPQIIILVIIYRIWIVASNKHIFFRMPKFWKMYVVFEKCIPGKVI